MRALGLAIVSMVLLAGCGGGSKATDTATPDVPGDVPGDGVTDALADTLPDSSRDALPDALTDVPQGDLGSEEGDVPPADVPDATDTFVMPDPAYIHVVREHADKVVDSPALIDEPVQYRSIDTLPDLDVRAIVAMGDTVWVGTASGLVRFDVTKDGFPGIPLPDDMMGSAIARPVVDLAVSSDGTQVAVAKAGAIYLLQADGTVNGTLTAPAVFTSVDFDSDGNVIAGTVNGIYQGLMGGFGPVAGTDGWNVKDVAFGGGKMFSLTTDGIVRMGQAVLEVSDALGTATCLSHAGTLGVWVAATNGLVRFDATGTVDATVMAGKGGLPTDNPVAVAQSGATLLVGHTFGGSAATVVDGDVAPPFDHYLSERWIPDDKVVAVAVASDGSRWLGTSKGVTRVKFNSRRIADKVGPTFDLWMAHFWRMDGFLMSDAGTDDAWRPTTWTTSDFDNDGLWTHMGIGALCMAYAVTQDEKYYDAAHKALANMFLEIDVPASDFEKAGLGRGFVTRSLVREDEGALYTVKLTDPRWHPTTYQGVNYVWKDDTSSDETTGHFFGYPLYYDLCAKDDAERAAVAEHAGALAKYIVDGGYTLRDLNGLPTTFGHFEPAHVSIAVDGLGACSDNGYSIDDCMGAMYGAGWLNSIEILGHLLSAWHMTGDRFYYDAYETLIRDYRYDEVAVTSRDALTVTNPAIANHSDHELAMLSYVTLIRYEPNDERRAKWIDSLLGLYEYEIPERQPLWAAVVAMATTGQAVVPAAVQTLREMPQDLRDWRYDNSHRKDCVKGPNGRGGDPQWDTVFPYDEIRTMWWNGNPYQMIDGAWGRNMVSPMAFQLAYWAQRYAGILVDPPAK